MPMPTPLENTPDRANTVPSPSFMPKARASGRLAKNSNRLVPKKTKRMSNDRAPMRTFDIERNKSAGNSA